MIFQHLTETYKYIQEEVDNVSDINQILSEVDTACSKYKENKSKMEQVFNEMTKYQEQANHINLVIENTQYNISVIDKEISNLTYMINKTDESNNSYEIQRLNKLNIDKEMLITKKRHLENEVKQVQINISNSQEKYVLVKKEVDNFYDYLTQMRLQMINAASECQKKIKGFNESLQIIESMSGNMFSSYATSQISRLENKKNEYENNLNIAQTVVNKIYIVLNGQEMDGADNLDDVSVKTLMLSDIKEKYKHANKNSEILNWDGEPGNSKRLPKDSNGDVTKMLRLFGVDGIEYRNGDVDFSPVSLFEIEFDSFEDIYFSINEKIKPYKFNAREDLNKAIRLEWQKNAKENIVNKILEDKVFAIQFQEKTGTDVSKITGVKTLNDELKRVGLTMHETPDCKKIQFVPTKIHDLFGHSGGVSEMLERLISAKYHKNLKGHYEYYFL